MLQPPGADSVVDEQSAEATAAGTSVSNRPCLDNGDFFIRSIWRRGRRPRRLSRCSRRRAGGRRPPVRPPGSWPDGVLCLEVNGRRWSYVVNAVACEFVMHRRHRERVPAAAK